MMTHLHPIAVSIGADTSPVNAPSFSQNTSCAPTSILVPRTAETAAGRATNGGQTTISRCLDSSTREASSFISADASWALLYIFQLPAITGVRIAQYRLAANLQKRHLYPQLHKWARSRLIIG